MIDLATLGLIALAVGAVLFGPIVVALIREEGPATVTWFMDRYVAPKDRPIVDMARSYHDILSSSAAPDPGLGSVRFAPESAPNEPEPEPEPLPNLALTSRTDNRTETFALDAAERLAVIKMIYHKTSDPKATKASAILAGFGVKKGDSAAYRRASAIYDALFVLPAPPIGPQFANDDGTRSAATYPISGRRTT